MNKLKHQPSKIENTRRTSLDLIDRVIANAEHELKQLKELRSQFVVIRQREWQNDYKACYPQDLADIVEDIMGVAIGSNVAYKAGRLTKVYATLLEEKALS
jgi:hypothetical protein